MTSARSFASVRLELACWVQVGIVVVLIGSTSAAAAEPSEEEFTKKSKRYYERGRAHYERGKYRQAADKLRQAYALTPKPLLLYNIALAEWKAGDLRSAQRAASRASSADLPKRIRNRNEARLAAFGVIRGSRRVARQTSRRASQTRTPPSRSDESRSRTGRFGAAGWTGAGMSLGGAVSLGAALWLDRQVASAVEDARGARKRGAPGRANEILRQRIQPKQTAGRILLGAGTGLAAGGLAMLLVDLATIPSSAENEQRASHRERTAPPPAVHLALPPGGLGLVVEFR